MSTFISAVPSAVVGEVSPSTDVSPETSVRRSAPQGGT